ncbi:MAG: Cob(I)alamin adenosyltransferase PduO [Halanaerobium sp. 4-GBenrich]|jgi:cob(I)alamin adenosyltransferase|uniref:Corrinoid adenosyltransferase n=1 Tax=Halanaerobium congolense TaxID=54121 RepID=A0A1G6LDU7_9FIRM|nr:cob(I)yrinic acid a,c-diamide adenosyltransferase [Halanaerobium congolense]KXS48803.1 MAG: Cob(I)alamin adenosyltransferase PduO [Halanaerobium sp. T82-1]ODS50336.1 MAG: Cob(I)alamin adenosyltransferase PduO [Halanaerobium sp. 4-GBenrich]OEG63367.1 MAG: ATP:cob(I)alamin adenosyltransferase [Halanaerobium sp. MDAL1]PUU89931.1 MAG: Cob(I)alamin adenosyltransferase PduO [Halanaerobium sp.]PTX15729.1 cob(I)alamin adenosyltransferase [Halanaerobium congolense]
MKIYTKSGDKGKTSLFDNSRVAKDSLRVESYGTIDELNSSLGFAKNFVEAQEVYNILRSVQRQLFNLAGELATPDWESFPEKITAADIEFLEKKIDYYLAQMNKKEKSMFIIPGSSKASGALHQARTICRRAERRITTLAGEADISQDLQKYINRLSDLIYSLARFLEAELDYVESKKK